MGDNDLSDRVGVDEAEVEGEGNEVVVEDERVVVEVDGDEGPGAEVGEEGEERGERREPLGLSGLRDVEDAVRERG